MFNRNKFTFGKFAISFLSGVTAGLAAGLIIGPRLSRKTQREIRNGFDKIVDKGEELVDNVTTRLRKVV